MSEKKRILVVDDEPDFCAIVQGQLEKEGFEVEIAYNGVEGLEKVHANPPDAIVLDVMMPEMDGFDFLDELRRTPEGAGVPVVVLTAKDLSKEERARLNGGVARILQKSPDGLGEFLAELRRLTA